MKITATKIFLVLIVLSLASCMSKDQADRMNSLESENQFLRDDTAYLNKKIVDLEDQVNKLSGITSDNSPYSSSDTTHGLKDLFYTLNGAYVYCRILYDVYYNGSDGKTKVWHRVRYTTVLELEHWNEDEKYKLLDKFEVEEKQRYMDQLYAEQRVYNPNDMHMRIVQRDAYEFDSYAKASKALEAQKGGL